MTEKQQAAKTVFKMSHMRGYNRATVTAIKAINALMSAGKIDPLDALELGLVFLGDAEAYGSELDAMIEAEFAKTDVAP